MFSNALALLATAVVVNAMTGCASGPALPYEPDSPLTAHLPIRQAGIRDLRREFTPFFDAELEHLDFGLGTRGAGNYLHLPPPHAGAPTPRPGPSRPDAGFASTAVLIVPGFLGECLADQALPFSDGRVRERSSAYTAAYETYKTGLGLHSIEAIHVGGRAGSAANAALIDSAILTLSEDSGVASIVLVAYSKGVADTLEALAELQRRQAVPAKLQAFVSVAGAVMGTPIADRYE